MKLNFNGLFRSSLVLLIASVCFAGLPPTTSQKSGDSSNVTTFNFKFPNFTGSRNGVTTTFSTLSIAGGGTGQGTAQLGFNALSPCSSKGGVITSDGTNNICLSAGGNGQVLSADNTQAAGLNWVATGIGGLGTYWSGYISLPSGGDWGNTNGSGFIDPTPSSTPSALTTIASNGLTVTAAASNLPGITFTPSSASAVYFITCKFIGIHNTGTEYAFRLYDGTNVITVQNLGNVSGSQNAPFTLTGIYAPATTSAVTVKLQLYIAASSVSVAGDVFNVGHGIEWQVFQINGGGTGTVTNVYSGASMVANPNPITAIGTISVGTVGVANGGTGLTSTPSNGQLLIGNGSGFTLGTLISGSNITITNASGAITIASSGGGGGGSSGTVSVSTFTSAGTAAYATPSGCLALEIEQVGGGGGGGGTGTTGAGSAGGNGGDSYFGTSSSSHYVYTSGGGGGPVAANNSFAACAQCSGGTLSVSAPAQAIASIPGAKGEVPMNSAGNACWMVAHGAATPLSPMPTGALSEDHAGTVGLANSGAGGSGTCDSNGGNDGCGGCAGAYVHYWIDSPSGTYALQVGAAGSSGAGGSGTAYAGGAGAAGYVAITCHF